MKLYLKLFNLTQRLEKMLVVRTIRGGLLMLIPVLMIGAFALIARSFPIPAYLQFIRTFADGFLDTIFNMIYTATFGMLSIYMTLAIGISYRRENQKYTCIFFGPAVTALICFFVLSGVFHRDFSIEALGVKGMLTAILSGLLASLLYTAFEKRLHRRRRETYADGADIRFNGAVAVILPAALTVLVFALCNTVLSELFGVHTFYQLIINLLNGLFVPIGNNFGGGLLFVVASGILWFFGVHGSDCLEGVMQELYTPVLQTNLDAIAAGGQATGILTKQFFDVFVLMGGCGTAMCLLLALLIFGRRRSDRRLAKLAAFPMIFNINETMVFGLPIILNPVMLIPFVLTPAVCYLTSYLAMATGLVGVTVSAVEWTTPVLLGGYIATGSVGGALLQLVNLILGVLIYAPFVKLLDRQKILAAKGSYDRLVDTLQQHEEQRTDITLTELEDVRGEIAKTLVLDLQAALSAHKLRLYYQPQYHFDGSCIGAEALLRWEHELFGFLYPPLIIKIAEESGLLTAIEQEILSMAIADKPRLSAMTDGTFKLSVNITGSTLSQPWFLTYLQQLHQNTPIQGLCLEVTEQTAVRFDDQIQTILGEIKDMDILLAIDDFSMGQTSINYLKDKHFDLVKLDGSLVGGILENPRCRDIISSITSLAQSLDFAVLAEYVETAEQRDMLASIGCRLYQGYLYAPALPLDELEKKLKGAHHEG